MPLALPLLAVAAITLAPNSTTISDARPPQRFHDDRTVTVQFTDQTGINRVCHPRFGAPPAGMKTNACATGKRVVAPNPCEFDQSDAYAHLLCHELGHMNGWPATHGD
jgi:hypothetical protein